VDGGVMNQLAIRVVLQTTLSVWPASILAQETEKIDVPEQEQVIRPELDRRDIKIPKIDAQDFEIGVYAGTLSVEDFGAKSVTGVRLSYHITEDFFIEGTYAKSKISDESFRRLGIALFPRQEEDLEYYNLSVGVNLFPGEVFVGKKWAMTSAVYLIGGVGETSFVDRDNTTFNFGVGVRLLPSDWVTIRVEMRDHLFESDLLGKNELKHNFELSAGVSIYF
jgi:outer membrane beta-barrel protein